jgi:beta-carotene hydroxylase
VPFTNFSKTHNLHHLHTNDPDKDPDHFMNARHAWELPFRALGMPHQWFFWLLKRDRLHKRDVIDLVLNYVGILAVFGTIAAIVGPGRVISGVGPALVVVSMLLWYPFAFKTHEGFSTGSAESRSHSYYGRFMYWFSLGLSLHREHHMKPALAWIELRQFVRGSPEQSWRRFLPHRDIRPDAT